MEKGVFYLETIALCGSEDYNVAWYIRQIGKIIVGAKEDWSILIRSAF